MGATTINSLICRRNKQLNYFFFCLAIKDRARILQIGENLVKTSYIEICFLIYFIAGSFFVIMKLRNKFLIVDFYFIDLA